MAKKFDMKAVCILAATGNQTQVDHMRRMMTSDELELPLQAYLDCI